MRIHKIEIAKRQIDVAIDLLGSDGDYLAIITLAGAAEEILGKLIQRQNKLAMVDRLKEIDRELTGEKTYKIFNKEINGIRNALKHANNLNEDEIEVELDDAMSMLSRAVANYVLLGQSASPNIIWFYNYLKIHVGESHADQTEERNINLDENHQT